MQHARELERVLEHAARPEWVLRATGRSAASDGMFSSKIIRIIWGVRYSTAAENVRRRQTAAAVTSPGKKTPHQDAPEKETEKESPL